MGVQIQTVKKQGFLRQIAEQAKKSASSLRDTLIAAQAGHFVSTFQRGRLVINQSGSGQSGSFEISMPGKEWTQDNVFGLIEELIQLVDLTVSQGTPDCTGDEGEDTKAILDTLLAVMFDNMNSGNVPQIGIREQMGDFSGLNFPANSLR